METRQFWNGRIVEIHTDESPFYHALSERRKSKQVMLIANHVSSTFSLSVVGDNKGRVLHSKE